MCRNILKVSGGSNVLITFVYFCNKNFMASFHVKLQVLDTCVTSALFYACETWPDYGKEVEAVYRSGLRRTALGIRTSINNEIVYIESDRFPLKCKIKKQQLKFWLHLEDYISTNLDLVLLLC